MGQVASCNAGHQRRHLETKMKQIETFQNSKSKRLRLEELSWNCAPSSKGLPRVCPHCKSTSNGNEGQRSDDSLVIRWCNWQWQLPLLKLCNFDSSTCSSLKSWDDKLLWCELSRVDLRWYFEHLELCFDFGGIGGKFSWRILRFSEARASETLNLLLSLLATTLGHIWAEQKSLETSNLRSLSLSIFRSLSFFFNYLSWFFDFWNSTEKV